MAGNLGHRLRQMTGKEPYPAPGKPERLPVVYCATGRRTSLAGLSSRMP
jgi:hypothetical protein